jgi:hypothetical protein
LLFQGHCLVSASWRNQPVKLENDKNVCASAKALQRFLQAGPLGLGPRDYVFADRLKVEPLHRTVLFERGSLRIQRKPIGSLHVCRHTHIPDRMTRFCRAWDEVPDRGVGLVSTSIPAAGSLPKVDITWPKVLRIV